MPEPQPNAADHPPRLSLAEAAARSGRHPEALRAMVRRGRLKAVRGNDGRLLVELTPELEAATAGREPGNGGRLAGQLADLETLVGELRDELLEARLRSGKLEAERDGATALADARVAAVQAEVAAKDALIAELKALLADARRPWWARLLGR